MVPMAPASSAASMSATSSSDIPDSRCPFGMSQRAPEELVMRTMWRTPFLKRKGTAPAWTSVSPDIGTPCRAIWRSESESGSVISRSRNAGFRKRRALEAFEKRIRAVTSGACMSVKTSSSMVASPWGSWWRVTSTRWPSVFFHSASKVVCGMGTGSKTLPFEGSVMTAMPQFRPSCLTQTSRVRSCERHPSFTWETGSALSTGSGPSTRKRRSDLRAVMGRGSLDQMTVGKFGSQAWLQAFCRSEEARRALAPREN